MQRQRLSGYRLALPIGILLAIGGCGAPPVEVVPGIDITTVPDAGPGGSDQVVTIAGRVTGSRPGDQVVLFARSGGIWWVQPFTARPFTSVASDATWSNQTHVGTEYAAFLVASDFVPPETMDALPAAGGGLRAVAAVKGAGDYSARTPRMLTFSGYEWEVRHTPSNRGGANEYDPANAWLDADGMLHLKLARRGEQWTSAEVTLTRSLGYGTYAFVIRESSHLDPAAAIGMLTWDDEGADQNHRELDIEVSQWGDPALANVQFVVQPYYVAANVLRFSAPAGRLTHSFRWEPGRAAFRTVRGPTLTPRAPTVSQHEFTSGVPVPGNERVRINLYYFRFSPAPLRDEVEVVIEKFQYFP